MFFPINRFKHIETKMNETSLDSLSDGFIKWEYLNTWINKKQKKDSDLRKIVITHTYEKRDLFVLSVSRKSENPAVILVGGEEGRDWMSPTVILHFIDYLLEDKSVQFMLDFYNFYFLPIFNPDGYVFSMTQVGT